MQGTAACRAGTRYTRQTLRAQPRARTTLRPSRGEPAAAREIEAGALGRDEEEEDEEQDEGDGEGEEVHEYAEGVEVRGGKVIHSF